MRAIRLCAALLGLALAVAQPLAPIPCTIAETAPVGTAVCTDTLPALTAPGLAQISFPSSGWSSVVYLSPLDADNSPAPFTLDASGTLLLAGALNAQYFDTYSLKLTITVSGLGWSQNVTGAVAVNVTSVPQPPVWQCASPMYINVSQTSVNLQVRGRSGACDPPMPLTCLCRSSHPVRPSPCPFPAPGRPPTPVPRL